MATKKSKLNSIVEFGRELGDTRYFENRDGSVDISIRVDARGEETIADLLYTVGDRMRNVDLRGYYAQVVYQWNFSSQKEAKEFRKKRLSTSDKSSIEGTKVASHTSYFKGSAKENLWVTAREISKSIKRRKIKKPTDIYIKLARTKDGSKPK